MYLTVVSWFLISFVCNGGGGGGKARRGRTSSCMYLLLDPPKYGPWNLPLGLLCIKPPMHLWCIQPCAQCLGCMHNHYLGKWEGVRPWNSRVFWAPNDTCLSAWCHFTGPKKLSNSREKPLPLALVMDMHASKTLCTVYINHRCINS
jgi:hypothetical protein